VGFYGLAEIKEGRWQADRAGRLNGMKPCGYIEEWNCSTGHWENVLAAAMTDQVQK
jgi:hypothetical protein